MKVERRRHIRVPGPFTAVRIGDRASVRIVDLSEGGCFIESAGNHPPIGGPIELKISFPDGESILVRGETIYVRPGGYAVLFEGQPETTYRELERAVDRIRSLTP
ncbi:MAG TPA: PilZ domain-containing protein [Vicinamibacterales bacterium]|jgi:hypothetical protein